MTRDDHDHPASIDGRDRCDACRTVTVELTSVAPRRYTIGYAGRVGRVEAADTPACVLAVAAAHIAVMES